MSEPLPERTVPDLIRAALAPLRQIEANWQAEQMRRGTTPSGDADEPFFDPRWPGEIRDVIDRVELWLVRVEGLTPQQRLAQQEAAARAAARTAE